MRFILNYDRGVEDVGFSNKGEREGGVVVVVVVTVVVVVAVVDVV